MAKQKSSELNSVYHLVRLSSWSGDFGFCREQCQKIVEDERKTKRKNRDPGYKMQESRDDMVRYAARHIYRAIQSKGSSSEDDGFDMALVATPFLRGVIYQLEQVVFELRAFPSSMLRADRLKAMKKIQGLMKDNVPRINRQRLSHGEWTEQTDIFMRIEFNGLGQIRAVGYWCKPPSSDSVRTTFKGLLNRIEAFE